LQFTDQIIVRQKMHTFHFFPLQKFGVRFDSTERPAKKKFKCKID
jgi:hypothetical protein